MSTGITLAGVHWGNYKKTVAANTDYKKFDDMLRQILSGTVAQRKQLEIYLEALHQQGDVIYGMHASPSVLMTCLVFERENQHMHFVDGSNGGYAMAAKTMKQQIANKVN